MRLSNVVVIFFCSKLSVYQLFARSRWNVSRKHEAFRVEIYLYFILNYLLIYLRVIIAMDCHEHGEEIALLHIKLLPRVLFQMLNS